MLHKLQNHKKMNIEKLVIPTDSLESMHKELNKRESKIVKSTVGVLLVDFSFSKAKEIIHPALKWFNTFSGKDINLYLPGYVNGSSEDGLKYIFENNEYVFDENAFMDYCKDFFQKTGIEPTYSPTLVLFEHGEKDLSIAEKIVIDLSPELSDAKKFEELFKVIFSNARKNVSLNSFSNALQAQSIIPKLSTIVQQLTEMQILQPITTLVKNVYRFRIQ